MGYLPWIYVQYSPYFRRILRSHSYLCTSIQSIKNVLKFAHSVAKSSNVNRSLNEGKNLRKASPFLYYHIFKEISPEYPAFAEYKSAFCPSCSNCYIYFSYFFIKQQKLFHHRFLGYHSVISWQTEETEWGVRGWSTATQSQKALTILNYLDTLWMTVRRLEHTSRLSLTISIVPRTRMPWSDGRS